ncbi:cytoplasmic tRNA 2-thiolation protein 2 [Plenodomus lingam]|uniref:cytoplasmic tRNA 2-thiolation protein 2 n=1 Tax=Leptosphaeria maculans TaxID=5022 RepID=UPI0033188E8A|nr:cytoplasmic tRNA 2-thiolation protein 2 [Plenodomus lingam]
MPSKQPGISNSEPCRRCHDSPSVLVVRSEPLCHECFARYVHTKCIKRLESFRVNFSATAPQRRVLVPLSFGVSSIALLHILHLHLTTQKSKTGRTGFSIHAVHIEDSYQDTQAHDLLRKVQEQYPDCQFTSLPLHDVFSINSVDPALQALLPEFIAGEDADLSPQQSLTRFMASLTSAAARADVLSILRTRLIIEHAKATGCQSVLWGDSTTKLAEKTLSETAKGRGYSLPWQVTDGPSPFGLNVHYPLRDVLKKELVSYINMAQPELAALVQSSSYGATQASTSSKNTTIDDLMKQYFESVEENFPSIVSNVVRTTSKLQVPAGAPTEACCSLCKMPVPGGKFGIHGWGGDQQDGIDFASVDVSQQICYGCTRSIPKPTDVASHT